MQYRIYFQHFYQHDSLVSKDLSISMVHYFGSNLESFPLTRVSVEGGSSGARFLAMRCGSFSSKSRFLFIPRLSCSRIHRAFFTNLLMWSYFFSLFTGKTDHLPLCLLKHWWYLKVNWFCKWNKWCLIAHKWVILCNK